MDPWVSRSNQTKQTVLAVGCSVTGVALLLGFRNFGRVGTEGWAGFLLGALLLVIGVGGLLASAQQTVVVDRKARRITIEEASYLSKKVRTIPFSDIVDIGLGYLGKRSNYVTWYYLVLRLRNGEEYPLFSPGRFFEGGSNRSTVEGWRRRLETYLAP